MSSDAIPPDNIAPEGFSNMTDIPLDLVNSPVLWRKCHTTEIMVEN
jgi:hypothetical protein